MVDWHIKLAACSGNPDDTWHTEVNPNPEGSHYFYGEEKKKKTFTLLCYYACYTSNYNQIIMYLFH